jgi:copper oxidase (laccase) domain-containing protein
VAWWTTRSDGDLRAVGLGGTPPAGLPPEARLRRLHQVHGAEVIVVGGPVPERELAPTGDALVSRGSGDVLAVLTADCAAVALASTAGVQAAVHVGWRGLLAGVVEEALSAMAALGADDVEAGLGPCIGPCCYEFTGGPLEEIAERYGDEVRGRTRTGTPALDLAAAVRQALTGAGARLVVDDARCTGCSADAWSHRVRGDDARQALFVWRPAA